MFNYNANWQNLLFFRKHHKNKVISCFCVMRGMVCLGSVKDAGQGFWLFLARALV
jgi:hypothetical protein